MIEREFIAQKTREFYIQKFVESKIKPSAIGAMGELNHPMGVDINLDRVSHYITELKMDGNNGMGKAKIATTPTGQIAKALLNDGARLGVSTRGLGKLSEEAGAKKVSDYELVTVDLVGDPSAPDAYVESVMEGLRYYIDENNGEIKTKSLSDSDKRKVRKTGNQHRDLIKNTIKTYKT